MRIPEMLAKVDLAFVRASADGKSLSPEMTLLLALVMFDGYEVFPAFDMIPEANPPHQAVTRRADRVLAIAAKTGTVNKTDRSDQYQEDPEARTAAGLLKSNNAAHRDIRQLKNLQLRNALLTLFGSFVLSKSPEIIAFLARKSPEIIAFLARL